MADVVAFSWALAGVVIIYIFITNHKNNQNK